MRPAPCLAAIATLIAGTAALGQDPIALADDASTARAVLTAAVPRGFDDLVEPHPTVVDIYFGGMLLGTTSGTEAPGWFEFDEPDQVVALIPGVMNLQAVISALSGRLDGHVALVCGPEPRPGCGELHPAVAGIIHDRTQFRIDIFVAPELLEARELTAAIFLPGPDAGLSFISNLAGSVNGADGRDMNYTIQNRSILAWRNARLISDVAQSSSFGFEADILAAELDTDGLRFRGGLFWSFPLAFTGQARVYGASIGSQYDTLALGDAAYSQPLVVFVMRRAQVNIYRDGRLLSSGLYDPGNQTIDTERFPSGAYNLVVEFVDEDGGTREEVRFFSKDRTLPPPGRLGFSVTAGVLAHDSRSALPSMDDDAFVQGSMAYRLDDRFALEAGALLAGDDFVFEAGGAFVSDGFSARAVGLVGNHGNYGVIGEFTWFDLRDFSLNGYVRRTWGPGVDSLGIDDQTAITPVDSVNLLIGDSTQFGGNVTYRIGNANLRLSGYYFQTGDHDEYYSIGPGIDYAWRVGGNTQLTIFADARRSSDGWDARIGGRLNFAGPRLSVFGELGGVYRKAGPIEQEDVFGNVLATYSKSGVLEGDLSVSAGYAHDLDSDRLRGEVLLDNRYGRLDVQAEHIFGDPLGGGMRYSANFSTNFVAGGGLVTIGGNSIGDSGIIARLSGDAPGAQVDVIVDNSVRATISSGQSVPIFLPAYRTYRVRVVPVMGAAARFDTRAREITIYAGNMASLEWSAEGVHAVFGRLLDVSGAVMADTAIAGTRDLIRTDGSGYFQAELTATERLTARGADGRECTLDLPSLAAAPDFVRLGDTRCLP